MDYSKEPIVSVHEASPRAAKLFLIGLIAVTTLISSSVFIASLYSNHYGFFGPKGQLEFYNGRLEKVALLKKQAAAGKTMPDAWIIGSSNTMPFQPALLNELLPVENSFNLGSYWGRAEDLWAWTNFILKGLPTAETPKLVVFGVEPWTFADDQRGPPLYSGYRRRLLATEDLARYLPDYSKLRLISSQLLDSLTFQSMRTMLRMSARHKLTRVMQAPIDMPMSEVKDKKFNGVPLLASPAPLDIDGTSRALSKRNPADFLPEGINTKYAKWVPEMRIPQDLETLSSGRQELVTASHVRLDEVVNFLPGDRMSGEDLELFTKTIELLNERGVPVAIIMLPMHPYFYDLLIEHTQHSQHLKDLKAFLDRLQNNNPNVRTVIDASHIARFGGDPFEFHDNFHMTPDNTDKVLMLLRKEWFGDAKP